MSWQQWLTGIDLVRVAFLVARCLPAIDALLFPELEHVAARLLMDFLSLIHHASPLDIA